MSLTGSALLAGVIGWPVGQSLSPALHGHWLRQYGIDGAYVPLAIAPADFSRSIDGLVRAGFKGFNVTVPHKESAFALAVRHDAAATAIGAVNLLVTTADGLEGRNTDAYGLAATLTQHLGAEALRGKTAAIWGAGGTTRAAIHALDGLGVAEIRLFNRTPAKAVALASSFAGKTAAKLSGAGYDAWSGRDVALIVHTTSAGMKQTPSLDLGLDDLPAGAAVFDAVYNPLETGLLAKARTRGLKTVDGLWMLLHQAVPSFEAFFGVRPEVTAALRAELVKALQGG
ncbi:shikimate dehydrogenase [Rhizomicrobium electricum]|uniref:Shikimate dehydrogenase (NADP(+)) n=1 Tax=Rhizomicrobium electricum TaxID=480070 RepID=A0ABN1F2K8_9PROT|nr:shikimate dehydrogenase [Rhizomicrobium electricum]NIJ49220.1 shikimate dehydrogenase [Rhizomicrobium electricum]